VTDATTPLWRGAVLLRVLTLAFAAGVVVTHYAGYARPALAAATILIMAGWTALTSYVYLRAPTRWRWFVVLDLAVCCAVMTSSRFALTVEQLTMTATPLVSTIWVTGVVAAGAVHGGAITGVTFGVVIAAFNFGVRGYVDTDLTRDAVLLVVVGFVLGLAASTLRQAADRLARALRQQAATAERQRLARSIHDGVLQVLATVRKRGTELGGQAAELATLAAEQEVALRSLIATGPPESTAEGDADLRAGLQLLATARIHVSLPATPVALPASTVSELVALVREALHNVDRHAGPRACAWVLLEDLSDEVVISVRDDGIGIPAGRVEQAQAEGRMGISRSIRGRAAELGGTATVQTAPGAGTEWEVRAPRKAQATSRLRQRETA
jgi:signal transduction histidine kinase